MSSSERPGPRTSGLRILLIEDEIMIALLLEDMRLPSSATGLSGR